MLLRCKICGKTLTDDVIITVDDPEVVNEIPQNGKITTYCTSHAPV